MFPFIKKDDDRLPNNYEVTVWYLTGEKETFEIASHYVLENGTIELVLKEDLFTLIPLSAIRRLAFDKRFSKIVEINKELKAKQKK